MAFGPGEIDPKLLEDGPFITTNDEWPDVTTDRCGHLRLDVEQVLEERQHIAGLMDAFFTRLQVRHTGKCLGNSQPGLHLERRHKCHRVEPGSGKKCKYNSLSHSRLKYHMQYQCEYRHVGGRKQPANDPAAKNMELATAYLRKRHLLDFPND